MKFQIQNKVTVNRFRKANLYRPFRAIHMLWNLPQGVALGYDNNALSEQ